MSFKAASLDSFVLPEFSINSNKDKYYAFLNKIHPTYLRV